MVKQFIVGALLSSVLAAPALARDPCSTRDLAGVWRYLETAARYGARDVARGVETEDVMIRFGTVGNVRWVKPLREDGHVPLDRGESWVELLFTEYPDLVEIEVGRLCHVRMTLYSASYEAVLFGQMTPDKQVILGQGFDYERDAVVQFQMVRRADP